MKILAEDDVAAVPDVLREVDLPAPPTPAAAVQRVQELAGFAVLPDLIVVLPSGRADRAGTIVHAEYVKAPADDLPHRMVEYRLRTRAMFPRHMIVQAVLVLTPGLPVPDTYTDPDGDRGQAPNACDGR